MNLIPGPNSTAMAIHIGWARRRWSGLAVVVQAIVGFAPKAARTRGLRLLTGLAVVAAALGIDELLVLFGAGLVALLAARATRRSATNAANALLLLPALPAVATVATAVTLPGLFGVFVKIGSVLFGGGYLLLAFLRADLVERLGWLTEGQLIDAVAFGR